MSIYSHPSAQKTPLCIIVSWKTERSMTAGTKTNLPHPFYAPFERADFEPVSRYLASI